MGVNPYTPPGMIGLKRNPTPKDNAPYLIGDFWLNLVSFELFYLAAKNINGAPLAEWVPLNNSSSSGILTLSGNDSIAVPGDILDNINVIGLSPINITGNVGTNTLTVAVDGSIATGYLADDGNTAIPAGNTLVLAGSAHIETTVVPNGDDTVNFSLANFTDHALAIGIATGDLDSLALGLDGQVLVGDTGNDPAWKDLVAGTNITITEDATSITIDATAAGTLTSLTGDSGGAIVPVGGNIDVIGDGSTISVAGSPGTLTISADNAIATSYVCDVGSATPALHVLNVIGSNGLSTTGAGNTITIPGGIKTITGNSGGAISSAAGGNINVVGNGTSITIAGVGNTLTASTTGAVATSYITAPATGTAIPAAGVLTFGSSGGTTVTAVGSTVTIHSPTGISDYEQGVWFPVLSFVGQTVAPTFVVNYAYYTKINQQVTVAAEVDLIDNGTAPSGGFLHIIGYPFSVGAVIENVPVGISGLTNFDTNQDLRGWIGQLSGTTVTNILSPDNAPTTIPGGITWNNLSTAPGTHFIFRLNATYIIPF